MMFPLCAHHSKSRASLLLRQLSASITETAAPSSSSSSSSFYHFYRCRHCDPCSSSSSSSSLRQQVQTLLSAPQPWLKFGHQRTFASQHQLDEASTCSSNTNDDSRSMRSNQGPGTEEEPPLPSHDVTYQGPLSKTHSLLKRVSLANTSLALAAAPAIVMYADASLATRVGLALSLAMFGVLTTGALHWITNPYVHELKYDATKQEINVRTTSLLSTPRWDHFTLLDVHPLPWNRPVATFVARNRFYYIDVYSFPDANLLKRLTPKDVPEGYKEDADDD